MTHVVVAGWLLGATQDGAGRRLVEILKAVAPRLSSAEQVTLLYARDAHPPDLPPPIRCVPVAIPAGPVAQRYLAERRILPALLHELGTSVYEQGHLPIAPRLRCPTVLTLHDLRDLTVHRRYPRWLARMVLRSALRRAAWTVVPSEFTYKALLAAAGSPAPKATVIRNGAFPEGLVARPQAREEPCFLHVGRLEKRKNLVMLLSAYAQFLEGTKDPRSAPPLVLAGADGGERVALAERAAFLEITGKVHFLGAVDEPRLAALYQAALCVLVPSVYEGFGLTALEGLASGKPVLVSDRGALPEVVGDAGVVLPAEDPRAWANALARLDALRADPFLTANRTRRVRELSWDRAAESMLELWHELSR